MSVTILNGGVRASKCGANVDELYGPYLDVDTAFTALENTEDGRSEGTTVGVYENGKVVEYWLLWVGEELQLVPKTLEMTPASPVKLGGVKTTIYDYETEYNTFDTLIDGNQQLRCAIPEFEGSDAGLVPKYDRGGGSTTRVNRFLNAEGDWAPVISESTLNKPLQWNNGKIELNFDSNSFEINSLDQLSLNKAGASAFGGVKASDWTSGTIPPGYICCEAKFGILNQSYTYNNRPYRQDSGKLYVYVPEAGGEGVYYSAGEGIAISNQNLIYLKTASNSYIGGIKADVIKPIEEHLEIVPIYDPVDRARAGITDKYVEVKKGVSDIGNTDPKKLYVSTLQILSVMNNRNTIGQLSEIDITDYASGTDYSLVFDSEYLRTTNEILVLKAGNYITIQGTVDDELHLEDVGSYSDSEFPATTYVLVKTANTAKFYFSPYNDETILLRDRGYLLKDTATVSKTDFDDDTHVDYGKKGMLCDSGYYLLTIFGNILQIDKLADKRDID